MRFPRKLAALVLLLGALAPVLAATPQDPAPAAKPIVPRWESSLSAGAVLDQGIGVVKAFWWYAVPKIVTLGLSFDYFVDGLPLSVNVGLNAPLPVVVPFVCAGAGASFSIGGITHYGGGIKVRLGPKFGLVFDYRKYHYQVDSVYDPGTKVKMASDYFGGGICWTY
jgi:hypothetical protein